MSRIDALQKLKALREKRALIALARARKETQTIADRLAEQTRLRDSMTDMLQDYLRDQFAQIGAAGAPVGQFDALSLGLFRRKRAVVSAEIRRRRILRELEAQREQTEGLAADWRRKSTTAEQIGTLAADARREIADRADLVSEEAITDLMNQRRHQ